MRTAAPDLLPMFRSDMQVELLGLLLLQPDRTWTLDELSERLVAAPSSVHRELHRLVKAGIARREAERRPHRFAGAPQAPAYRPLRDLLELTTGAPARLGRELEAVPGIVAAAIHGSWATGQPGPDSDLDVIVVTDGDRRAVQRAVRRVGRAVGREVDASVLSRESFIDLARSRNPFVGKIVHGPRIDVIGDLASIAEAP